MSNVPTRNVIGLSASGLAKEPGRSLLRVQEPLLRLRCDGLALQSAHQTTRVTTLSPPDAWEMHSVRGSMEGLAGRLSLARLGKESLMVVVDRLSSAANRMSDLSISDLLATLEPDLEFHARIGAMSGN